MNVFDQTLEIANFIATAFLHIWPYLLITIPLAVLVRMSGAVAAFSDSPAHPPKGHSPKPAAPPVW